MAYTRESVPELSGLTSVVTGGRAPQAARVLAIKGAHVVIAVRRKAKAEKAMAELRAQARDASVELVEMDLALPASVKKAAARMLDEHETLESWWRI